MLTERSWPITSSNVFGRSFLAKLRFFIKILVSAVKFLFQDSLLKKKGKEYGKVLFTDAFADFNLLGLIEHYSFARFVHFLRIMNEFSAALLILVSAESFFLRGGLTQRLDFLPPLQLLDMLFLSLLYLNFSL